MGRSQEEKALKKQGEPVAHDALEYLASLDSNGVRLGLHRMERALDDLGRPSVVSLLTRRRAAPRGKRVSWRTARGAGP